MDNILSAYVLEVRSHGEVRKNEQYKHHIGGVSDSGIMALAR